jgi:hypothetical protein
MKTNKRYEKIFKEKKLNESMNDLETIFIEALHKTQEPGENPAVLVAQAIEMLVENYVMSAVENDINDEQKAILADDLGNFLEDLGREITNIDIFYLMDLDNNSIYAVKDNLEDEEEF